MKFILIFLVVLGMASVSLEMACAKPSSVSSNAVHGIFKRGNALSRIFSKSVIWQYQLKQKMSNIIRDTHDQGNVWPLFVLLGMAFLYGVVHAIGPGHGKFVVTSYVLSGRVSLMQGITASFSIAVLHALSGVVGVLGLKYIFQASFHQSLAMVDRATQIFSYALIIILGLLVLFRKDKESFVIKDGARGVTAISETRKSNFPWVLAAGIVPCPGVIMVLIFCLAMDALVLGLCASVFISLGMGTTISLLALIAVKGKGGVFSIVPSLYVKKVAYFVKMFAGIATVLFGAVFLLGILFS